MLFFFFFIHSPPNLVSYIQLLQMVTLQENGVPVLGHREKGRRKLRRAPPTGIHDLSQIPEPQSPPPDAATPGGYIGLVSIYGMFTSCSLEYA